MIHDPEPRTIKPFEVKRPYVTTVDGQLYVTVFDVHRNCEVRHPAVVRDAKGDPKVAQGPDRKESPPTRRDTLSQPGQHLAVRPTVHDHPTGRTHT